LIPGIDQRAVQRCLPRAPSHANPDKVTEQGSRGKGCVIISGKPLQQRLARFAVSLWPQRRERPRGYFYLLPADVANCYAPRMVGEVTEIDRLAND